MAKKKETTRRITLSMGVPVRRVRKTAKGFAMPVRYNVAGMMQIIRRSFKTKDEQDLLNEYAKFWALNAAGVKFYPLEK
jgi:hypothetical protein